MTAFIYARKAQLILVYLAFAVVNTGSSLIYYSRPFDDASHYLAAGRLLAEHGRLDDHFHAFYFVPIALVAAFTWLSNDPQFWFVVFQMFVSAIAVYALYNLLSHLYSGLAAFIGCLMFVCWMDNIRWNAVIMSESLFNSVVIFFLSSFAMERRTANAWLLMVVWMIVAVFTRPTGLLLMVAGGAFCVHTFNRYLTATPGRIALLAVSMAGLLIWGGFVLSSTWNFTDQYFRGNVVTYADQFRGDRSLIQIIPPDTSVNRSDVPVLNALKFVWNNPVHVWMVSSMKTLYLLTGVRPYYSGVHNVSSLAWMIFVYSGCVTGFRRIANSPLRTALLTLIVANVILVAVSTVDWDNRFFIPMEAPVVIFSAIGWSSMTDGRSAARSLPEHSAV